MPWRSKLKQQAHDLGVSLLGCNEKSCGAIIIRKVNRGTVRQQDSHQLCKSKLSRDEQGSEAAETSGCIDASALREKQLHASPEVSLNAHDQRRVVVQSGWVRRVQLALQLCPPLSQHPAEFACVLLSQSLPQFLQRGQVGLLLPRSLSRLHVLVEHSEVKGQAVPVRGPFSVPLSLSATLAAQLLCCLTRTGS